MSFDFKYEKNTDGDNMEVFLQQIVKDAQLTEKEILREAGKKAEEEVVRNLSRIKRGLYDSRGRRVDRDGRPALADDVKLSVRKNKWGELTAQIKGGKNTGTLWHIVNDGNLYSTPTFFLDGALNNLDKAIDNIWDRVGKILK